MNGSKTESRIHELFRLSLLTKGAFALLEVVGGVFVYFSSPQFVQHIVTAVTANELSIDPDDFLANLLVHTAHDFSVGSQYFVAFYLFGHGVIKLILIFSLWREKLWAYPASLVVFTLFIAYQIFRFTHTHSIWLLVLTVLDLLVIWLVWHEYKQLKRVAPPLA